MERSHSLIYGYLDGSLTDDQFVELQEWLRAGANNEREFVRATMDHAALRIILRGEDIQDLASELFVEVATPATAIEGIRASMVESMLEEERQAQGDQDQAASANRQAAPYRPTPRVRPRRPEPIVIPWSVVYGATAAAFVGLSVLVRAYWPEPQQVAQPPAAAAPQPIATITSSVDSSWGDPSVSTAIGTPLSEGSWSLADGIVELTFTSGAKLVVDGPAEFDLISSDRVFLTSGKVVGRVPLDAAGFTVMTANSSVIDLGTEFGVFARDGGASEVHVFDGEVQVVVRNDSNEGGAKARQRLTAGDSVEVDDAGNLRPVSTGSPTFFHRVPRVVNVRKTLYSVMDARLVDSSGDGLLDRADPLDRPSPELFETDRESSDQLEVGIGEKNSPRQADTDCRRYLVVFDLEDAGFAESPTADRIKNAKLDVVLSGRANAGRIHLDLFGLKDPEAEDPYSAAGGLLADHFIGVNTRYRMPVTVDVTSFVKDQVRQGQTRFAFRVQADGDLIPNLDGKHNSYILFTRQTPEPQHAPRLHLLAMVYDSQANATQAMNDSN